MSAWLYVVIVLTLTLNGKKIYTRKIEAENDRTFGFYHDKHRCAARMRNVVLRGDWPERLSQEQLSQLYRTNSPRSKVDRRTIGAIFNDQHVHGWVLPLCRHARTLPLQERYEFLSRWVLPSVDHDTLRLALDFTPTNPAPPVSAIKSDMAHARTSTGGELVSPSLDLIEVAKELDKLAELRQHVTGLALTGPQQLRSKLAMLALIDIAAENFTEAKTTLDQLAPLVVASQEYSFAERWPETLAIWGATPFAETRAAVRDMAFHILVNQIRKNQYSGNPAWDQHMRALASRVSFYDLAEREAGLQEVSAGSSPLANWFPVTRDVVRTRGQGFPRSQWAMTAPTTVRNFAGHDEDYLFFRMPLRGNFEIECDLSSFGWKETFLGVAGKWTGLVYTLEAVDIGDYRGNRRLKLRPPFHRPDDTIHYRVSIRDGVCSTYCNGRKLSDRAVGAHDDPWIAICSHYKTDGAVHGLRITGDPQVPAEIKLTANEELQGWIPINIGHRVGRNRKWQQLGNLPEGGGIRGKHWDSLPGSYWETLIRYHRPMIEDGTIEYDFFYREGDSHVHPALDRLAFLLQPDGVRIHWVTDEQFDRTDLGPDNVIDEPDIRLASPLPLKANDWNHLQLSLQGDTVELTLNDQLVCRRELEATNQRTFGLFHYADQTEALVRNVVWRGDWPRELPALEEQQLAGAGSEFLDATLSELTAVFEHDFAQDGHLMRRFGLHIGRLEDYEAIATGLRATRTGGTGYVDTALSPHLRIKGDFDIVAEFEQFEPSAFVGGTSGVFLQAILDNKKSNECLVYRRHLRYRQDAEPIIQGMYVTREPGGARRTRTKEKIVEAEAGRLRLARRGDQLYYLFAANDSPHYRLFGSSTVATDDIRILKLMTQTHMEGTTKVVWKKLTIRANDLSGLALQDHSRILTTLNQEREKLPQQFVHDFAKDGFSEDRFQTWGPAPQKTEQGLQVVSEGTDRWTSAGLNTLIGLQGDFDVSVKFDEVKLATPKIKLNSALYLQIDFPDSRRTQVNMLLVAYADGDPHVYAQVSNVDEKGNKQYHRLGTVSGEGVNTLRLARRGKSVSFMYRVKDSKQDDILVQFDVGDQRIPTAGMRVLLHTGGDDRQSEVLLKTMQVKAETIAPNPADATNSPSLLRSILDLFGQSR